MLCSCFYCLYMLEIRDVPKCTAIRVLVAPMIVLFRPHLHYYRIFKLLNFVSVLHLLVFMMF